VERAFGDGEFGLFEYRRGDAEPAVQGGGQ
jgi:hypothetical protein